MPSQPWWLYQGEDQEGEKEDAHREARPDGTKPEEIEKEDDTERQDQTKDDTERQDQTKEDDTEKQDQTERSQKRGTVKGRCAEGTERQKE